MRAGRAGLGLALGSLTFWPRPSRADMQRMGRSSRYAVWRYSSMYCKLSSSKKTLQASGLTASKIASMRCPKQLAIVVSIMMALEKLKSLMWSILF